MLKLMYITNQPDIAKIADDNGVDRIFVDLETLGKQERQGGMDTVQSRHSIEDIPRIKAVIKKAKIMVRVNPLHDATGEYLSSKDEIDAVIEAGADIIMLPYFKSAKEVETFIQYVSGRVKVLPLVETPEAVNCIDEILSLDGLDEIFVGLNDLSLGYGKKFMFELLADGTLEILCAKFRQKEIPFGFGGIASLGKGMLPSEYIIREHYRLGSTCVILSRSFCRTDIVKDLNEIRKIFETGLPEIRQLEEECEKHSTYFQENRKEVVEKIRTICQ